MSQDRDRSRPAAESDRDQQQTATSGPSLRERLERERRRAVRAEARLAEIELALRREIERGNDDGVSAQSMRSLLEVVQNRIALLEEELRASEQELAQLAKLQSRQRGDLDADDEQVAFDLEEARHELRDAVRLGDRGLSDLTRQRLEFEVELDRVQSLVTQRDSVCEGLSDELDQGTRAAAEVTQRLNDLSWGRVAPARRSSPVDARVAKLRRDLENEQLQLRQAKRALETARAELKIAQRGVLEIEGKRENEVERLQLRIGELQADRDRLAAENRQLVHGVDEETDLTKRALDEERFQRVRLAERERELAAQVEDLEGQLNLTGHDREVTVRARLAEVEHQLEETETERVRLAERVSLLQAALSAKESELGRARQESPQAAATQAASSKVVELKRDKTSAENDEEETDQPTLASEETERLIREREREIEKLSERWRGLQGAYRDAVAEFDEVREKRDQLVRSLGPAAQPPEQDQATGAAETGAAERTPAEGEDEPLSESELDSLPEPEQRTEGGNEPASGPTDDELVVTQRDLHRPTLVHLDDASQREIGLELAGEVGAQIAAADDPAPSSSTVIVANLAAREIDALDAMQAAAADFPVLRAVLYARDGGAGWLVGATDVFVPPFEPAPCATYLREAYPELRRAMVVGEAVDAMNRLRELLGRARCSTAVAFDPRQALELLPLVRPEYVLVDLAIPDGAGVDLLLDLEEQPDAPSYLGVTWSRPIDGDTVRAVLAERLTGADLDRDALAQTLARLLLPRPRGSAGS